MKLKLTSPKVFRFALIIAALAAFAANHLSAQTTEQQKDPSEVQQLKERLKQLEQTVQDLKGQLTNIEASQKTASTEPKPVQVIEAVARDTDVLAKPANTTPAKKPAGGSTFEIYGFAMLDAGYQFGQNHPDWFDVVRPTKLPSFQDEFAPSGNTYFGVRQSRVGVKSTIPTKWGDLKTIFEVELFGSGADAGKTTFRLRHAYGELGQFGAGQNWSVFVDTDAFPNTVEYWGPNGLVWYRNVQIRWMPFKGRNALTIGLERPGASGDQGALKDRIELSGIRPRFGWPDLTANFRMNRDWGHIQIGGILRSIRWIDTVKDQFDFGGKAIGFGGAVSSALKFGSRDVGRFQVTYGTGIENYMNDAPVDIGAETNASAGDPRRPFKGVALPVFGFSGYLDHKWNTKFTSALGYSIVNIQNSNAQRADAFHTGHYASGNLLYSPVERVTIGGEFIWGRRDNFRDGFSSNDYRMQFAFKYNFSKLFEY
jgi:hypothetical protein